ncbi:MAG: S41 family peptidase [Bacteroidota bacterium]|jgi:carboxyl-terminal processing protease|nr:S41 family peptidase [Bacteroidota bacterium]
MSRKTIKKILLGIFSISLLGLFSFNNPSERFFEIAKNLDIFATLFKEVNTYYVDDVNPNQLISTGIEAMLASLDPYTNYIPEDAIEDFRTMTTGQYGGIGALIGQRNGKNMVLMPYKGFPAQVGGLMIGDEILKIDGIDVKKKSTSDISKLLKGQANTDLNLTIKRFGQSEQFDIRLKRERITIQNIPFHGMVTDNVGYVKLSDFTAGASKEVKDALQELKNKGAKKIIFDLRDNPGGLLSEAVNISNLFINKGSEVVSTKGKMTDWNKSYKALNSPFDTDIPLVILTSSRSASAAEIVAGVVQDYDRGVLVGQKSFGKGLVQATRPLTYNSQLKVTTAKYYTPSGRCIQAIDYSHRNEDGSVGKVPDSLKVAFKTKSGRVVYDGGGIDPDIAVEKKTFPPIAQSLSVKGLIFDYATEFRHRNQQIKSPKDFKITEEEYNNFVSWLSDKDYDYVTKVEKTIEDLIENAKDEQYYEDINKQILSLKTRVQHNKEHDLQKFKEEIKVLLKEEIIARYYYQQGIIEASFNHDEDVKEAVNILNDSKRYEQILSSSK